MLKKDIPLTSAEIAILWTSYMNNSMSKCVLGYMLKNIQDEEIKPAVQFAFDIASRQLQQLIIYFEQEQFAIPNGFTDQDVNMEAPRIYTDVFCLTYVNHMAKVGLLASGGLFP